ncbi:MAG: double zinc ribbon domain-containing protein [Acetobacter sp.]|nr:double zinc ribbon domain-containing protein [Bacteroides sp.]MCM1341366.1 double zinc ribbon domain-containing protein [Acetobacter sp.]MCM1433458.1 double zinc ribbon domain-containing protein [Clostridiales bacterium]
MNHLLKVLSKAVFTNRCALCGEVIELDDYLCNDCANAPRITEPICESCGCNTDDCHCKKNKNEYKKIVAPFYYCDTLVPAIHRFKESDMPFIAEYMGKEMAKSVKKYYSDIEFDYITYVPMNEFKKKYKGYNQAELLANEISKCLKIETEEFIYKSHYTKELHKSKTGTKRSAIVYGTFDIYEDYKNELKDKIILLVDDVKTTGATLNECAKMLNIYGAKAVYCVSCAVTKKIK